MFENDFLRLSMIRALGGKQARANNVEFWGVLDNEYVNADGVDESAPVLTCRTSDATAALVVKGTTLTVSSETFRVRRAERDGEGMVRLVLGR